MTEETGYCNLNLTPERSEMREPRKKKRVLTESRKEQNRRAQKLYRERHKELRVKEAAANYAMEERLVSIDEPRLEVTSLRNDREDSLSKNAHPLQISKLSNTNDGPEAFEEQHPVPCDLWIENEDWNSDPLLVENIDPATTVFKHTDLDLSRDSSLFETSSCWPAGTINQCWLPAFPLTAGPGMLADSTSVTNTSSPLYENQAYARSGDQGRDKLMDMFYDNRIKYEDIILAGLEALSNKANNERTQREVHFGSSLSDYPGIPTSYIPSPAKSHISMVKISLTAACIANATHIWTETQNILGLGTLMGEPDSTACIADVDSKERSPFFSPSMSGMNLSYLSIACDKRLKPDLRPCIAQVTQDHALYLDTFPFPAFRERVLALKSCVINSPEDSGKGIFDENDLIRDFDNEGVVCWGSDSHAGTGSPWDHRSWEFRPWFLKKWWMLTGGLEGEIGRQSSWWAEMRGEDFDEG